MVFHFKAVRRHEIAGRLLVGAGRAAKPIARSAALISASVRPCWSPWRSGGVQALLLVVALTAEGRVNETGTEPLSSLHARLQGPWPLEMNMKLAMTTGVEMKVRIKWDR